ncbi:MAG TPA: response regulator transcription factor [Chthoniobacteraceae bacterium]
MPSVWIIEDNPAFRRAAVRALGTQHDFAPVRGFERCEDALLALKTEARPDAILLDIGLPGMDGISGIQELKALWPELTLLVLTVFEDDDKIFRAVCAGASGYLLKSEPMQRVAEAIREALTGGSPMNPRVARRVLEMFSKLAPQQKDYGLTEREQAVLELMVEGLVKKQIADRMDLNLHTADYVIRCIYRKLHVNGMTAAVSLAVKERLV